MHNKNNKAFSLIELLITLIIISIVMAALTPVITKKLKSQGITVGAIGGNSQTPAKLDSQAACDKIGNGLLYLPPEYNNGKAACVYKYNVGDAPGPSIASSVTKLATGQTCSSSNCCWQGATAVDCSATDDYGSEYSSCNRTVCGWNAANSSCQAWSIDKTQVGDWRLPTKEEMDAWGAIIKNETISTPLLNRYKGTNGLQLCNCSSLNHGSSKCYPNSICPSSTDNNCYPHAIWTSTLNSSIHYHASFDTALSEIWTLLSTHPDNSAFSARCLIDEDAYAIRYTTVGSNANSSASATDTRFSTDCDSISEHCSLCSADNKCLSCNLESCPRGTYADPETCQCTACADNPEYGADCVACNAQECTSKFNCNDSNFMRIGNLCVTRKNIGDGIFDISANVTIKSVGANCNSGEACCWQGTTANTCTGAAEGYSGCNRTVCNWHAAKILCDNFNYDGRTWRLPTAEEITNLGYNHSIGLGSNGLMLCDYESGYSSIQCGADVYCATNHLCLPYHLWSGTLDSSGNPYQTRIVRGVYTSPLEASASKEMNMSVRCVTDMTVDPDEGSGGGWKTNCSAFSSSCTLCNNAKCLSCGLSGCGEGKYVEPNDCVCKSCADKFGETCLDCNSHECTRTTNCYGNDFMQIGNLCITRRNVGDSTAYPLRGVTVVQAGSGTCNSTSDKCCWYGSTSGTCDSKNGDYSGCTRTVCNRAAAEALCSGLTYDNRVWRLPYMSEIENWGAHTQNLGNNGLMLCHNGTTTYSGISYCAHYDNCLGAAENRCHAAAIWSRDNNASQGYADGQIISNYSTGANYTASVRCVTDMSDGNTINNTGLRTNCTNFGDKCAMCNSTKCLSCGLGSCPIGEYVDSDTCTCKSCADAFGKDCVRCNSKMCLNSWCSGPDLMKIGNLCVPRRNMGDSAVLTIPRNVTVANSASTCGASDNYTAKCCWQGQTAEASTCSIGSNSTYGTYSGCTRTVCTWAAANEICSRFNYRGKNWRLPTNNELKEFDTSGDKQFVVDLKLCDGYKAATNGKPICFFPAADTYCKGAYWGSCYPYSLWAEEINSSTANSYNLSNTWYPTTENKYKTFAVSTRCVTEVN